MNKQIKGFIKMRDNGQSMPLSLLSFGNYDNLHLWKSGIGFRIALMKDMKALNETYEDSPLGDDFFEECELRENFYQGL